MLKTNDYDPYLPPIESGTPVDVPEAMGLSDLDDLIRPLGQTRPWVLFIAVVGLIVGGMNALSALVMTAVAITSLGDDHSAFLGGGVMGAMSLFSTVITIVLGVLLLGYARRIRAAEVEKSVGTIAEALSSQRQIWKVMGIMTIALISLIALLFLVGAVFGVIAAASHI